MPINANPDSYVKVSLSSDSEIPEDKRPKFLVRFATDKESHEINRLFDQAATETDIAKARDLRQQAISIGIAGWENVKFRGQEVNPGTPIEEFLTASEAWELVELMIKTPRLTEDDKKKSSSPSTTKPASSAPDASKQESVSS